MRSDLHFRPATMGDLAELHALVEGAYRGESARAGWTHEADLIEGPRTSREALAAAIESPDDLLLVALRGACVAGCVQLTRVPPDRVYIGMLTVDPKQQAAGLGKRILAEAEQTAMDRFGAAIAQLSVVSQRSTLIAYYERRGYRLTGERRPFPVPLDPPLTLVVLEKPLPPAG